VVERRSLAGELPALDLLCTGDHLMWVNRPLTSGKSVGCYWKRFGGWRIGGL